ncbi:MAG: purine-nucleoside phosphorylase [Deltaproteobacteria bacterium]|nr:purine-nucleoside phosphorylase [Deltaproteobacteria bacterium]
MLLYEDKVYNAADYLKPFIKNNPKTAILTGTGLGDAIASSAIIDGRVSYKNIPYFPVSTTPSHNAEFIFGSIDNLPLVILFGRLHLYEGFSAKEVAFPIRVIKELGIENLIITNASGGINPKFCAGDVMIISDHINLTGANPLTGPNNDKCGIRFPDMSSVYNKEMIKIASKASQQLNINIKQGVYAGLMGPSLETPAEIKFLKIIGADAVGLSTIQEVIAAVHSNVSVLGLSAITNIANSDNPTRALLEDIIKTANKTAVILASLIKKIIRETG